MSLGDPHRSTAWHPHAVPPTPRGPTPSRLSERPGAHSPPRGPRAVQLSGRSRDVPAPGALRRLLSGRSRDVPAPRGLRAVRLAGRSCAIPPSRGPASSGCLGDSARFHRPGGPPCPAIWADPRRPAAGRPRAVPGPAAVPSRFASRRRSRASRRASASGGTAGRRDGGAEGRGTEGRRGGGAARGDRRQEGCGGRTLVRRLPSQALNRDVIVRPGFQVTEVLQMLVALPLVEPP